MTKKYILGALNICLFITLAILLIIGLTSINLYNNTKCLLIASSLLIISIILIALYFSKDYKKYNIGTFMTLLFNIILLFNVIEINQNYNFIENLTNKKYDYITYELYVKKSNTTYSNIKKLENKKIGLLADNKNNVEKNINNLINVEYKVYYNLEELYEGIQSGEIQGFIIDSRTDKEHNIYNKVRVIYSNKIKINI